MFGALNPRVPSANHPGSVVQLRASILRGVRPTTAVWTYPTAAAISISDGEELPELRLQFAPRFADSDLLVSLNAGLISHSTSNGGIRFGVFANDTPVLFGNKSITNAGYGDTFSAGALLSANGPCLFSVRTGTFSGTGYLNSSSAANNAAGIPAIVLTVAEIRRGK